MGEEGGKREKQKKKLEMVLRLASSYILKLSIVDPFSGV